MALPAFTIHTAVKQATKAFRTAKSPRVKAWGPTVTGLAVSTFIPIPPHLMLITKLAPRQIVPFLPYLFDHPVETAVDYFFDKVEHRLIESHTGTVPPAAIEEKRDL
jgi:fission process protein 1